MQFVRVAYSRGVAAPPPQRTTDADVLRDSKRWRVAQVGGRFGVVADSGRVVAGGWVKRQHAARWIVTARRRARRRMLAFG